MDGMHMRSCRVERSGVFQQAKPSQSWQKRPTTYCRADSRSQTQSEGVQRRTLLSAGLVASAAATLQLSPATAQVISPEWEQIKLPIDPGVVLLDIGFTGDDPNHGFLLGTRQTLLETFDGGKSWEARSVQAAQDEGFNYRFNSISFNGSEGWIVGRPAILLHTLDSGKSWERVPLSAKLPGNPAVIFATPGSKAGQAEMVTDQGAVYVTDNSAYTWQAAVQETVDATLNRTVSSGISGASYYEGSFSNIRRAPDGSYVAVSSRGNFFLTWSPGEGNWTPHNRPQARRIQNMGYTPQNSLWLSLRGGDVYFNSGGASDNFDQVKLGSRGFGILDVGFKPQSGIGFACGGSGSLFKSEDGGKSWKRDRSTDAIAGNLYAVSFEGRNGFILGNDGILLRYIGSA